ncbi:MAG: threonine ammonia-lyase [Bacillota bacterium]|nr:threonine ammonia-lyase [Bacillota bacterium]
MERPERGVEPEPTPALIRQAAERLQGVAERTPLLRSPILSERYGVEVFLKAECLQRTGSFKVRGAYARILGLSEEERRRGVVAASAGNHAQGVAFAAAALGIPATIVMPVDAPITKRSATERYGARVVLYGESFDEAFAWAVQVAESSGATLIHAFDDPWVIAGQGTVGLEIAEEMPDVDTVLVPVGGGGLASGVALALKASNPSIRVIGVQSAAVPAAYDALRRRRAATETGKAPEQADAPRRGHAPTLADGLAVKRPSERTLSILERLLDDIVLVGEEEIARAILHYLERERLVVEGAGAVTLAALAGQERLRAGARRVVLVVSGGNIDVNRIARIIDRGLYEEGRVARWSALLDDRPGALERFLHVVAEAGANVLDVVHDRIDARIPVGRTRVTVTLELRDAAHGTEVESRLTAAGYDLQG